ncbi:DUF2939 domain-containing protein [Paraburkholderia bannensis]|uniref:DUF2939 domain-containing protein n=1 Tax=Paraburkholderia tropica TaxID=92647 RepID=A0AAQ1GHA7_9BURK|nr:MULTISPECIES: DUF2939 domain-containing protein [Paraburkholderia]QNB11531.1 DUF2939 domain-containing protein [Paraburkholderia tropica]RQM48619.1 DUF2939 domain-containing protein [Paraburkholderia bannensis]RQN35563.1 DUF2939 domain-containing protein [Paraburkholderia tropica]SEJ85499.1 Protein of unknown function [Paraburkholderia tropica]
MTDTDTPKLSRSRAGKSSNWKKPVAIAVAAAAVVAALGYGYASPYIALNHLKQAADARDAAALSEYVDYPALRASLKQQAGEMLQRRIQAEHSSNPLLLFGAVIGSALIGPLVDAYATPEGVAALLNGMPPTGKPGEQPAAPPPAPPAENAPPSAPPSGTSSEAPANPGAPAEPAQAQPRSQATAGYRSINEFAVTWQRSAHSERYAAILERHGLFSWKLAAVELNEPDSGSGANTPN